MPADQAHDHRCRRAAQRAVGRRAPGMGPGRAGAGGGAAGQRGADPRPLRPGRRCRQRLDAGQPDHAGRDASRPAPGAAGDSARHRRRPATGAWSDHPAPWPARSATHRRPSRRSVADHQDVCLDACQGSPVPCRHPRRVVTARPRRPQARAPGRTRVCSRACPDACRPAPGCRRHGGRTCRSAGCARRTRRRCPGARRCRRTRA